MRAPDFWRETGWQARLLAPAAAVWGLASRRRAARPARYRAPIPVICVGNLVAGGAGKTPVVLSLVGLLARGGDRPQVLTRGYGGANKAPLRVDPAVHDAGLVGDEALLLAANAPTWVAADRAAGAALAVAGGAGLLLLDDGFQDPALHKDISLLVIDGDYGLGNGRLIPAGPLREGLDDALARAQAVVLLGEDRHGLLDRLDRRIPVLAARLLPGPTAPDLAGQAVLAFAGIGRPQKFFATLRQAGATISVEHAFADHHPYSRAELAALLREAEQRGLRAVTTEKDLVRLPHDLRGAVTVLPVEVAWENEAETLAFLHDRLILGSRA